MLLLMEQKQRSRGLVWAGNALIGLGLVHAGGAAYFCWTGGLEGILSPAAAVAAGWPIAAVFLYLGSRMRRIPETTS